MFQIKKIIFIVSLLGFVVRPVQADNLGQMVKLNPGGDSLAGSVVDGPIKIITRILPNVFVLAGLIMLFLLLFGGYTIVSNAGNPEGTQKGQQAIITAIIGFAIIISSYWVVQIIEIITGISILSSPALTL